VVLDGVGEGIELLRLDDVTKVHHQVDFRDSFDSRWNIPRYYLAIGLNDRTRI